MSGQSSFRPQLESLGDRIAPHAGLWTSAPGAALHFGVIGSPSDSTPRVAASFNVKIQRSAEAGSEALLIVTAVDANGRPVRDYTGTVSFSSSDASAVLPDETTFTESDRGRKVFRVTLNTTGEQTVTVTDTANAAILGEGKIQVQAPAVATHVFVRIEQPAFVGGSTRVLVAALDANNRPVRSYTGTVSFSSSGVSAELPEDYTFTAEDRGVHIFTITPGEAGELTVTATDTADAAITGSATTTVKATQTVEKIVVLAPRVAVKGSTITLFLAAVDSTNCLVTSYTGTMTLTASVDGATLPAEVTFTAEDRGVKAVQITLPNATGPITITATDSADATLTASARINVIDLPFRGGFGSRLFTLGR